MPPGEPSRFHGLIAVAAFLAIAWACSSARRRVNLRIVVVGLSLQAVIALLLLRVPATAEAFDLVAALVAKAISFADEGSRFVFGSLSDPNGTWGFVFAFRVIPVIIFFAALMAVLYQLRVVPMIVAGMAWCLRRSLGVTGTEALATASNVLIGQTEAPLCVRPYLPSMTRSQLMVVMTGGFATIAGSVLAGYVSFLGGDDEARRIEFARHLLTASLMSAPAAFVMAKLLIPETEAPDEGTVESAELRPGANVLDAIAIGAGDGLKLSLNVAAMLIAFVSLLALLDWPIRALGDWMPIAEWRGEMDFGPWGITPLLGLLFTPVAWMLGIASGETSAVGELLGTQIVATEFIAYLRLADMQSAGELSHRSVVIATYALCGFANLPSIAIQIGGLGALAPSRRADLSRLAFRAMCGGAMACWSTAAIAAMVLPSDAAVPTSPAQAVSLDSPDPSAASDGAAVADAALRDGCGPQVPAVVYLDDLPLRKIRSGPTPRAVSGDLATLHNLFEIEPGLFSGSGPETEAELDALAALGVRTIVSVDGAVPLAAAAEARGMRSVHLPIGYDTVDISQRARIVRAVRDLPRPLYLHCHHGRHRGPAAIMFAEVALGRCDADRAVQLLGLLGTSRDYPGLYAAMAEATALDGSEVDSVRLEDLPAVETVADFAAGMARADRIFERLESLADSGWQVSASHPDLVAAVEAGMLTETFRGLRSKRPGGMAGDGHELLLEAFIGEATALEQAIGDAEPAQATAILGRLDARCDACHRQWRNPSGP